MASLSPTYVSNGQGEIAAFHGNQVIASGRDFAKVAETAEEYFNELRNVRQKKEAHETRESATHITTPNGEKGVILGRTSSVFSDHITVRFSNGQIRGYDTFVGDGLKYTTEKEDTPNSPVEYFQRKLDEDPEPGKEGLTARLNTLNEVKRAASHLASQNVSDQDGRELHKIVVAADAERYAVGEALDHILAADAEAMVAPKMAYTAVEQASLGHGNDWLEIVAQDMVAEAEGQDFDKLLADGPTEFVSSLETAALADAGVVRDLAAMHIHGKTAGFEGTEVEEYRERFVAAAELARRREAGYRTQAAVKVAKEASVADDTPDEALFL